MYIEKRKHPSGKITYRARIRLEGAPEFSESFPTRKEAENWGRKKEAEVRGGRYFGREESKEKTFAQFIDRYIEKELPKNPKGYAKQKMLLTWWKSQLGDYFLCHIRPSMIAELRDKLMSEITVRHRLRTPSTANRYLAALSRAYTICECEWHWVKENPVRKITRPKENKPRDRYLEKEEIERLLAACRQSKSPHLYAVTVFALGSGARKGEILGLKTQDLDIQRRIATFRDTKNGDNRTVHLSPQLVAILCEERGKRIVFSEYVFPSKDGKRPADIRGAWELVVKRCGFGKDVVFHSLRHTTASFLAMQGESTLEIGRILGHKSLSMINRYSHLSIDSTSKAINKMNEEIFGKLECG